MLRSMNFNDYLEITQNLANPEKATGMEAYMRNQFRFLGIPTPQRKAAFKPFLTQLKAEAKNSGIDYAFVNLCWQAQPREHIYNALDYLAATQKHLLPEDISWLRELAEQKTWWDSIDRLDRIIGNIVLRHPEYNGLMIEWSEDENFWIRRIAIDHQNGRKEKTNTDLLSRIILNNLGSKEFFINKAIGWSLREYSKTNPQWVNHFIKKHREHMSPLSVREGLKRIQANQ